jgi:hypothetical protein
MRMIFSMPWFAWIALAAIIGGAVNTALKAWINHRERMALIERGYHPDDLAASDTEFEAKRPYSEL